MITVVLPISRAEYLKEVFRCLSDLEKSDDTELLIVIDGDDKLEKAIDNYIGTISFQSIRIINHTQSPADTLDERRYRISDIHNQAKYYISDACDYVFLIEDDTTYPPFTLKKMQRCLDIGPVETAYIEGVELGRRNAPYVGAWLSDDIYNPTSFHSLDPDEYEQGEWLGFIDAGGLYCCLVRADLYKQHHFEPFDKEGTNGLSCDVNFGLSLRQKGYYCYIDWSIKCDHLTDKGPINIDNTRPVQVAFDKTNGIWKARTI